MPFLEKFLYLKKSKLPGSGIGLFTRVDITKGTRIVEYKGRLQLWTDVKHEDGHNAYLFKINSRIAVNAISYIKAFGRYANDAKGLVRIKGMRNNAEYEVEKNRIYIDAIRYISKNEEVLVEYGGNFWVLIHKIRKQKEQAAKKIKFN